MSFKSFTKTALITATLSALPVQMSFANSVINTLAEFNNGFISSSKPQSLDLKGVDSITTFQKGKTVHLQVSHDPIEAYERLINTTLMQGARINGLNFQTTFTLGVVKQYCDNRIFEDMNSYGYADKIMIEYKDQKGQLVKRHKISKALCKAYS